MARQEIGSVEQEKDINGKDVVKVYGVLNNPLFVEGGIRLDWNSSTVTIKQGDKIYIFDSEGNIRDTKPVN